MASWYAVHTKARQEFSAKQHLERQAFRTHLPLMRTARHRRGRWQALAEPLFPGYLFIQLDFESQNSSPIRSTRGVIGLVRFGNRINPVPTGLVEELIRSQPDSDSPIDPAALFRPGDQVSILQGPFAGLKAVFQTNCSQERVCVLLDLLGQSNPVTLSRHQVAPLQ